MTRPTPGGSSEAVLVVAPTGRDAAVTVKLLQGAGIAAIVEPDFGCAARRVQDGIGALLLTDLVLNHTDAPSLLAALERQQDGLTVPVLVLCREGMQAPAVSQLMARMVNVTVLDRPTTTRTLTSALQSALRNRRAQYQIRDQIARLREAEDALRQADRRKDEFLATLAHELRNPLAPLRNGITLLQHLPAGDARVGDLRSMMDRQLTQLVKLIDELLDVSRIATGKITLGRSLIDMREVVRAALESCEPAMDAAGHRLELDLPPAPALTLGDAVRLSQVVSNLVGNAIKYTPSGGEIRVQLAPEGPSIVLSVADNGAGIPAEMLEQVFDLFAQVNQTLDRAQGGLGIGLSLVRRLVQLHGGRITVHSEGAGRGSTFEVRLPAAQVPSPSTGHHDPHPHAMEPTRRLQLLVIDDNVDAADSLGMLLGALGHSPTVAYSASDGLAHAARHAPDAVFCDIGMPGMDGYAFAAAMRQHPHLRALKLIALTGWGSEGDKGRTRAAGFDCHLTKPADRHDVEAALAGV